MFWTKLNSDVVKFKNKISINIVKINLSTFEQGHTHKSLRNIIAITWKIIKMFSRSSYSKLHPGLNFVQNILTWKLFKNQELLRNSLGIVYRNTHCVKSVQIRSNFWSVFSRIPTRNYSVFGHFSRSDTARKLKVFNYWSYC